ncbi:DUF4253 domain-containing protein [Micromonospora eburnea]|uniref:DUF4253 domain-containing protein n=1 Tax=Micromonospora eburnea TaxID=227316 RepID=A0A1C6URC2_9ACTN|nr:DUF4253 domain-containing protein [Micromonospora eburnea]SCL56597.1 protein of unknown function [Micromonospora eburnea]
MTAMLTRLLDSLPPGTLPSGRTVEPEGGGPPPYWLSDAPVDPEVWVRMRSRHRETGLWPLLLSGLSGEESRPWADGEVYPAGTSSPDQHDAAELLARWWHASTGADDDGDMLPAVDRAAITAPFRRTWPGLAEPGDSVGPAAHFADRYAEFLRDEPARLGLVAATRGSDALAVTGWSGPANYHDTGEVAAVVRSWEERFGARVVAVGFDTLHLSVAAPPATPRHALRVAAEHFAFAPDNVWQGTDTLTAYAEEILGMNSWSFWWD